MSDPKPSRSARSRMITLRINPEVRAAFNAKAATYGRPSFVLRELVVGWLEGRVHIDPPTDKDQKESLYNA